MDIEPLKSILQDSKDKKDTLLYFLPLEVTKQVIHHDYEEKDFYIQERIFCIKRNTLELEFIGRILFINDNKITIKINSIKTVTINSNEYYIFIQDKKTVSKQRDFLKQLLEQL